MELANRKLIFFDGVCNLCNASVRFLYKRTKPDTFSYYSQQSQEALKVLSTFGVDPTETGTIFLVENGKLYTRSTAALRAAKHMKGLYPMFYALMIVPKFIRDGVYCYIAKNRYKWFGKQDEVCEFDPNFKAAK